MMIHFCRGFQAEKLEQLVSIRKALGPTLFLRLLSNLGVRYDGYYQLPSPEMKCMRYF